MSQPKVSIIIPVYNTEKYLKRCMDSITAQTLKELEIIIVDDGSKEPCAALCDELAKADSRIKVIHKKNAGSGYARNTGLEYATGEYVGFVDSDDYINPDMYQSLYDSAVKYDADLVLSGYNFVGGNTFASDDECLPKEYFDKDTLFENEDIKKLILGIIGALPHEPDDSRYGVSVWKNIFRNSLIQEHKIEFMSEREMLSEDMVYCVDFAKRIKRAVGIPGAFYCYCRNEDSFSKSYNPTRFEKTLVLLNTIEEHIKDIFDASEYKIYLDRLAQGYGRIFCSQEVVHARDEKIKYSQLRERLKTICTNEKIKTALKSHPWHKLPAKQAAFAFAMKHRLYLLQKIMILLRDR